MRWSEFSLRRPAFPAWAGPAERLRYLIRYATRAPSRHNAQPWLFEIEGPELRLFVDPRRALKVADPSGREATLACGAAIENLRIGAAHHGLHVEVEPCDPDRAGLVAIARLESRRQPTEAEEELFGAIPLRRTALTFHSPSVPPEELAGLAAEVGRDGMFRRVPRWLARPVAELVAEADALQWSDGRFRAELAAWTCRRGSRRLEGLPPERARAGSSPAGPLRRLLQRAGGRWGGEVDRRCDERTRTLLLLSTRDDGPRDWLAAGRAMQRLLLRATVDGLAVSFLSQPIEVTGVRRRLRREMGDPGWPQLLLRVGYGARSPATPRRPVELVLRTFASELAVEIDLEAPIEVAGPR